MKKITLVLTIIAFVVFSACNNSETTDNQNEEATEQNDDVENVDVADNDNQNSGADQLTEFIEANNILVQPTASGLYYVETLAGTGEQAKSGDVVSVHYTGTLLDGTKFDSSLDRNEAFEFNLGAGKVIKGWDEGIALMKVGGKATLIIPSDLAYGNQAVGGVIPANSPLVFNVELLEIK